MNDNARTGISSAALRYLQLIEQNEENGGILRSDKYIALKKDDNKLDERLMLSFNSNSDENKQEDSPVKSYRECLSNDQMSTQNNPFVFSNVNNPFTYEIPANERLQAFPNMLDETDILIDDSDINFQPETAQMSYLCPQANQYTMLAPTTSTKSFEFGSNSSKSFASPPQKRFRFEPISSFFNRTNVEQSVNSESFFKQAGAINSSEVSTSFFKPPENINNCTDDIFDVQNFNKSLQSVYSVNDDPESECAFRVSPPVLDDTVVDSDSDIDCEIVDDSMIEIYKNDSKQEEFSCQFLMNQNATASTRKTCKVNTFYQAPNMLDTEKIDEFYKTHNATDWKSDNVNLDNIMEPSLDYILQRFERMKPLTTGCEDDTISLDDEDSFNCDSINETIDEIEETFDKGSFICSTPDESKYLDGKNPMDAFGDLNISSNALSTTNVPQEDEDEDNNTTKSFLVNKESENVWSAITHVSCSIPLTEQENSEPKFDMTTIFDFPDQNEALKDKESGLICLDDDVRRYELMLSILRDCNYSLDAPTIEAQETLKIAENRKAAIMGQIEMLIEALVSSLVNQNAMIIKLHRIRDWNDCKYESNVLSQKETAIKIKSLSFTNKNTERTFTIVVHLLGEIHKLLGQNTTCTKRELYYRDVELMKSQVSVNKAIDEICALLNVQCWELGVLSTSKGLVAGDLRIETDEDEIIDYSTTNSVPQKPSGIKSMESNAEYVLVVEKDTVFTRLIEDNIMEKIGKKIILVTAKGFPDINTRVLLKRIESELQIPIYIIVDADAYGIEIMCTYKFGSLQMVKFSEQLAISTMEWIGIHPTDIEKLDITHTKLTDADVKKVDELLVRPYINDRLKAELEHLKSRGLKAEIESIYHFSIDYLIHDFIPQKIAAISSPLEEIVRGTSCFKENLFS